MTGFCGDLTVVAAEAPGWAVSCVGRSGTAVLDRFSPLERSWVAAEIHAGPGAYRDAYMQFLHPGYKVLHLTGSFHAAGFLGTVERLQLRGPGLKLAVIDLFEVADPKPPAGQPPRPEVT